jgi:hypothetical protein
MWMCVHDPHGRLTQELPTQNIQQNICKQELVAASLSLQNGSHNNVHKGEKSICYPTLAEVSMTPRTSNPLFFFFSLSSINSSLLELSSPQRPLARSK